MSGELRQISDLDRTILRLLARGWHTTDHAKSQGILSETEIAEQTEASVEEVRDRLVFLEAMGYVINEMNFGGDPTITHKQIDEGSLGTERLESRYHVSEHGMRMTLADEAADLFSTEQPG